MESNPIIPNLIEHKDKSYKLISLCNDFCFLQCIFAGCKGTIKYFHKINETFSWRGHSSRCRKNSKKEIKSTIKTIQKDSLQIVKTDNYTLAVLPIDPNTLINPNYKTVQIDKVKEVKPLYQTRFLSGTESLLEKVTKKKGKTLGIYDKKDLAASVSYIEWKIKSIEMKELVLLATDVNHEKKGLAKHLIGELMCLGRVIAWADIDALNFYKKLGFKEDNVLGWEISNLISYATFAVFVCYGISEEERKKLIEKNKKK